jgi:preprotein translocase subunit SecE
VARNRKRAQGRRRPQGSPVPANGGLPAGGLPAGGIGGPEDENNPLRHASPDEELAEAQLALGRPDLTETPTEDELDDFEQASEGNGSGGVGGGGRGAGFGGSGGGGGDLSPALGPGASPAGRAHKASMPVRIVGFVRGSWRELQRVQWPDRRQVMQATGVVLGFVIVAGAFLGVASFAAQKIVNLILYGHG